MSNYCKKHREKHMTDVKIVGGWQFAVTDVWHARLRNHLIISRNTGQWRARGWWKLSGIMLPRSDMTRELRRKNNVWGTLPVKAFPYEALLWYFRYIYTLSTLLKPELRSWEEGPGCEKWKWITECLASAHAFSLLWIGIEMKVAVTMSIDLDCYY